MPLVKLVSRVRRTVEDRWMPVALTAMTVKKAVSTASVMLLLLPPVIPVLMERARVMATMVPVVNTVMTVGNLASKASAMVPLSPAATKASLERRVVRVPRTPVVPLTATARTAVSRESVTKFHSFLINNQQNYYLDLL